MTYTQRKLCIRFFLPLVLVTCCRSPAETLRGIIRDASGRLVSEATVSVTSPAGTTSTTSSADGRFSIPDVSPPATVRVENAGFSPAITTWPGTRELEIVLRPRSVHQQVVVTATRTEVAAAEVAASVSSIGAEELKAQPALQIDAVLRQVPGFSLFRRTDSRSAHPTAQGVSLRGLGASGASRVLVMFDGVPLHDPFGGWVYWDRVPTQELGAVEVVRGGGSALYGGGALAGVVNLRRDAVPRSAVSADFSVGGQGTRSGSSKLSFVLQEWNVSLSAQGLMTDGYIPVASDARGPVDAPANVRYANSWVRAGRKLSGGSIFVAGDVFNESRQNGTQLQTNNTRLGEGMAGGDLPLAGGTLTLRVYGSAQRYNQTFSSIAGDRATEDLVRLQAVPAQQLGGSAQWVRPLSAKNVLALGGDIRQIRGHTDEIVLIQGTPTTRIIAGGHQTFGGAFIEDMLQVGRLSLTMALRFDAWRNYDAYSNSISLIAPGSETPALRDKTSAALSPSLGAVVRVASGVSLSGSAYGAFRSPTLNELYRAFRQGNVQTLANESLNAERLRGAEGAVNVVWGRLFARAGYFWNTIRDAVGNRTVEVTPELITRQRQNTGTLVAQGIEVEAQATLPRRLWARGSYIYSHATVNETLEARLAGLRIPQVPRHAIAASAGYPGPRWTATVVGRYVGRQYDDGLNRLPLPGYFTTDVFAAYRISSGVEAYIACENLLNRSYVAARTPVESLGSGTVARVGLKFEFPLGRR